MNWEVIKPTEDEIEKFNKLCKKHTEYEKECLICGTKFKHGTRNLHVCKLCTLKITCKQCGTLFNYYFDSHSGKSNQYVIQQVINKKNIEAFCSKSCSNMSRLYEGKCQHCGAENVKIYNGRCEMCANKELNGPIVCSIHGKQHLSFGGMCILCHNQKESMREQAKMQGKKNRQILYCDKCSMNTPHYGSRCLNCDPIDWNFGEFGHLTMFKVEDGIEMFFDVKQSEYVPWLQWKENFKIIDNIQLPNGFFCIPTFLDQQSEDWKGARVPFEKSLVDLGIGWFVYIKFYLNTNGDMRPIVVGKSGSKATNVTGSDVNFSIDPNDGPARKFLKEEGLKWCKTQIAILRVDTELEAYEIEKKIQLELGLFGS